MNSAGDVMENSAGDGRRWRRWAADCKALGEALQPFALLLGGIWALVTYISGENAQRHAQLTEISRPYYVKQLDLYLEASRVAAHLAASPETDREAQVVRFWELYWGELAFVESTAAEQGPDAIEVMMVDVCHAYVSKEDPAKCHSGTNPHLATAIKLAHQASLEVRRRWR